MTLTPRQEGARPVRDSLTSPRVGQFYLDVSTHRLHCLNEAARQLRAEGLPLTPDDPALRHLRTLDDDPVPGDHLPPAVAAREGRPAEEEFLLLRPGQSARHLHWSAAPLKDAAGRVTAVMASVSYGPPPPDWEALAGLAHDLRTPLQAVGLLLAVLGHGALTEAQRREAVERLGSAAERAQQIGKDLLEWCRTLGVQGRPLQPTWFALEPFLREMLAEQQPEAGRKGLTLGGELGPVLGWQVFMDRGRLGRVLANLLANAVRYTPAGGQVRLTAAWEDRAGERFLALGVADTGTGISPEEQES